MRPSLKFIDWFYLIELWFKQRLLNDLIDKCSDFISPVSWQYVKYWISLFYDKKQFLLLPSVVGDSLINLLTLVLLIHVDVIAFFGVVSSFKYFIMHCTNALTNWCHEVSTRRYTAASTHQEIQNNQEQDDADENSNVIDHIFDQITFACIIS